MPALLRGPSSRASASPPVAVYPDASPDTRFPPQEPARPHRHQDLPDEQPVAPHSRSHPRKPRVFLVPPTIAGKLTLPDLQVVMIVKGQALWYSMTGQLVLSSSIDPRRTSELTST